MGRRRRARRWLRSSLLLLGLWGGVLARAACIAPASSAGAEPEGWRGALHVHTTRSDGRASVDAVARIAGEAGLDFIVLGDHNVEPPAPATAHGVLVVPGVELSTPRGHVLAYGGGPIASARERRAHPLAAAHASGELVVLAHPINRRRPWTGTFAGADAMEVISADSAFREAMAHPWRLAVALLVYPASPEVAVLHLAGLDLEARARLHQALARGELSEGLCGHDAHGLPAYAPVFRVLRLHVPEPPGLAPGVEGAADASRALLSSLRSGAFLCAYDGLADPAGFFFETAGARVRAGLRAPLPEGDAATILLFRDGEEVARRTLTGPGTLEAPRRPGRWHVEVEIERPWLFGRRRFLWILSGVRQVAAKGAAAP